MKRSTLILMIIAASLVVAGVFLCVVGMALSSGDTLWNGGWIALGTRNTAVNEFEFTEEVSDIDIVVNTTDVEILPASDGVTKVVCQEDAREPHTVWVEDGTLKIGMEKQSWYRKIRFFSIGERKVTVYLAEKELERLSIKTDTGDVRVAKELSLASASVTTDTGEIAFASPVAGALNIQVRTGDVSVSSPTLGSAEITATTGDVSLYGVTADEIKIETSTGEIEATSVSCRTFSAQSSTGEQEYERVLAEKTLTLQATTGDISLLDCDAAEVSITTDTGDVSGRFLTEKVFYTETDTGRVNVPKSTSGGLCEITTDTGDIEFDAP
ncbi:MAG: DUF4097 family beta strand repeat protein [Clostridia bacterium]|nr:DUF4097 family beta strand repeat protein [Clostridia bacterium]